MHVCGMHVRQVHAVTCKQEPVLIRQGYLTEIPMNFSFGFGAVTLVGAIHAITREGRTAAGRPA